MTIVYIFSLFPWIVQLEMSHNTSFIVSLSKCVQPFVSLCSGPPSLTVSPPLTPIFPRQSDRELRLPAAHRGLCTPRGPDGARRQVRPRRHPDDAGGLETRRRAHRHPGEKPGRELAAATGRGMGHQGEGHFAGLHRTCLGC